MFSVYFKAEREQHDTTGASGKMTLKMAPIRMRDYVLALDQLNNIKRHLQRYRLKVFKRRMASDIVSCSVTIFDIVRMMITDPMHTILLGMVHNEIKLIISTLKVIQLSEFYSRIKAVKIPYDLGRLPKNLNGDSLAGLTAQQWKNFACIYARPFLVGLLEGRAYKSLCLLLNL